VAFDELDFYYCAINHPVRSLRKIEIVLTFFVAERVSKRTKIAYVRDLVFGRLISAWI